jgi:CheY-like chemotaxis protein
MKKILVLEEGNFLSEMITKILLNYEYELISTGGRSAGFNKVLRGIIPDLIIADLTTLKNNNVELLVQLKSNPVNSLFPFLFITSGISYNPEALNPGLNYYLSKPFTEEDLFQLLLKIFKESRGLSPW